MSDLFSYDGKKVVLTGGTTGVGAAAVELLADAGCTDLTVLDIKEPTGPATRYIPTDMSDPGVHRRGRRLDRRRRRRALQQRRGRRRPRDRLRHPGELPRCPAAHRGTAPGHAPRRRHRQHRVDRRPGMAGEPRGDPRAHRHRRLGRRPPLARRQRRARVRRRLRLLQADRPGLDHVLVGPQLQGVRGPHQLRVSRARSTRRSWTTSSST